jgi:chromate transporter
MTRRSISLRQLFIIYLKIGLIGFGPTLAAETKKYLVKELQWINEEEFLNGLALAQLLPGATYVSLTVYIGYRLRGIMGAMTSFLALLLLPFTLMVSLSYLYFTYGSMAAVGMLFKGVVVVVVGVVAHATVELGKSVVTDLPGVVIVLASIGVLLYSGNVFVVLCLAAIAGIIFYCRQLQCQGSAFAANSSELILHVKPTLISIKWIFILAIVLVSIAYGVSAQNILLKLAGVFFRLGAFLFGGGFSMIPFIQNEVVVNYRWLTLDEFIVGIALGQVTPGPVLIMATFIGYKVAAINGAIAATLGIFLPSLLLVVAIAEFHQKIRSIIWVRAALKGIAVSFTGMLLVFTFGLIRHSLVDLASILFATGIFGVLRFCKLDTIWVIIGGTLLYWLMAVTNIIVIH